MIRLHPAACAAHADDASMNARFDTPDAATWARLSPLLDAALDLPPHERVAWLAALQAHAPEDAAALQGLLERQEAAGRDDFLASSAHAGATLVAVPAAGHRIGPWTIEGALGEGGMASVWLARRSDGRHEGQAAIKLMHGRLHGTQASQRFEREGRILARLEHPHIARLLDAGVTDDKQAYLVLELVRGQAIDLWCDTRRLPIEARLALFADVAEAVSAAHVQLVVHRDLKPGNVMVTDDGQVKLLDFGIAKLMEMESLDGVHNVADASAEPTRTGQRAFTPAWAAPEQVRGDPVTTATDVWTLGVLLCLLLTGRHVSGLDWKSPFTDWMQAAALATVQRPSRLWREGPNGPDAKLRAAQRNSTPERLARQCEGDIDQIVARALAEEPTRRYRTALALADDVRRLLRHEPVTAHADTLGYRTAKFVRRHRMPVAFGVLAAVALVGGTGLALWQTQIARAQAVRANAVQDFLLDIFRTSSARQPDPQKARLVTARELLDIGAARLDATLADQPESQAEITRSLRELYDELGLLEQSLSFARRSVALAARLQGVDSQQHLLQLVELARLLNHVDGLYERQQVLAQGLAIAQRLPQRASPARVMLYTELAQLHQSSDQALAESYAQRAVADARAVGDDSGLWQALSVAGTVAKGRSDQALALARFSEALRVGERVAAAPGFDLLRLRVMLAESQSSLMQPRAAEATLRAALVESLRTLGPDHLDTHQTRLRLGRVLATQERLTEALAEQTINLHSLEAAPQPDLFTLPMVLVEISRELLALGRLPQAEATARRAITLRDQARAGTLMSAELREDLANALIAQQRLPEAALVLQEAATLRRANKSLPGQASWDRNAHTALAWASADQQTRPGRQDDPAAVAAIFTGLLAGSNADSPTSFRWLQGTLLRTDWDIRNGALAAAQNRLARVTQLLRDKDLVGRLPLTEVRQLMLCARLADARSAAAVASGLWQDAFTRIPADLGPEAPLRKQLTQWYAKRPKARATGVADAGVSPC